MSITNISNDKLEALTDYLDAINQGVAPTFGADASYIYDIFRLTKELEAETPFHVEAG